MAKKYGRLPPVPTFTAKVRGDAGVYKVWGIDWLNQRVLVERAGLEWIPAEKIALDPLVSSAAGRCPRCCGICASRSPGTSRAQAAASRSTASKPAYW